MKRIGYIYIFSKVEKKGILVYGHWNRGRYLRTTMPVKFSLNDCKTAVKTGQLVYFELSGKSISNIARASLANFDKELINDIITQKNSLDEYYFNSHISFEYLGDIIIPEHLEEPNNDEDTDHRNLDIDENIFNLEEVNEDLDWKDNFVTYNRIDESNLPYHSIHKSGNVINSNILSNIDELFDCFGKYKHIPHTYKYDSTQIDIFDISFWIDNEILKNDYYGSTLEEFSYIFDIFINRKRIDYKGDTIIPERENDSISDLWQLLISKFGASELRQIITKYPILQPAMPIDFCLANLNLLSDKFGMPNVEICKEYNLYLISQTNTASKYKQLRERFHIYANCNIKHHLKGEGIPMCRMGKKFINKLIYILDNKFETEIVENIKEQFEAITGTNFSSLSLINKEQINERIVTVGEFLEAYENTENNYYSVDQQYQTLPIDCKVLLYKATRTRINEAFIRQSKDTRTTLSDLKYDINLLKDWIDEPTKQKIILIMNQRFPLIDNL